MNRNPAPANSILLHVYRNANPSESEICRDLNFRCTESQPSVQNYETIGRKTPNYEPPPHINAWYLITDTPTGPTISEIFQDLPQDELIHSRKETSSVQIGSHLYDIGGCGTNLATGLHYSNRIRRLDTQNPSAGWKTEKLPFHCRNAIVEASGNFIYLIPKSYLFVNAGETSAWLSPGNIAVHWPGYVYDTIRHEVYTLEPPIAFGCFNYRWHRVIAPLEDHPQLGSGLLVPIFERNSFGKNRVYLHKPEVNSWEPLDDYDPIPGGHHILHYAVLNGILYVCDRFGLNRSELMLYVYDLLGGRLICKIVVPMFDNNYEPEVDGPLFVIPVSDSELCFLWRRSNSFFGDESKSTLFYVKVSLSLHPPAVKILKQAAFCLSMCGVLYAAAILHLVMIK